MYIKSSYVYDFKSVHIIVYYRNRYVFNTIILIFTYIFSCARRCNLHDNNSNIIYSYVVYIDMRTVGKVLMYVKVLTKKIIRVLRTFPIIPGVCYILILNNKNFVYQHAC